MDGTTLSPGFHLADVNYTAETVGIAYRDTGYQASALELSSAKLMGVDIIQDKIKACMEGLSIDRNNINWLGTNETRGEGRVYGLLNNPQLFDYVELPAGASGSTEWKSKTFMEIYNDIIFIDNMHDILKYKKLLETFNATKTLENIDHKLFEYKNSLSEISLDLWNKWLLIRNISIQPQERKDIVRFMSMLKL